MRLVVLSDIHGNLLALEAVMRDLNEQGGADKTWVLGDLCAYGPRPVECLQLLRELVKTDTISGNTDRYLVTGERTTQKPKDEADWKKMPETLRLREEDLIWTVSKL